LGSNSTDLSQNSARLPYRYCSKNVSGYRQHPRSVVAYSAEVAHRADCSTNTVVFPCRELSEISLICVAVNVC